MLSEPLKDSSKNNTQLGMLALNCHHFYNIVFVIYDYNTKVAYCRKYIKLLKTITKITQILQFEHLIYGWVFF